VKNPFGVDARVTLMSPLSPEACVDRLRAETGSMWNPLAAWTSPVRGSVNERGFRIVKAIHYQNAMQQEACGSWAAEGDGTRVEVTLAMNRFGAIYFKCWLLFVGAFAIMWLVVPHHTEPLRNARSVPSLLLEWLPVWMLLFGVGLVYIGRWEARSHNQFMVEFLQRTLECPTDAAPIE
jgi:hypothetical protein